MALPAGFSDDDDWFSDDEISFANESPRMKRTVLSEKLLTKEQKLINVIMEKKLEEAKLLLEHGANVNYKPENFGWSPLMQAASLGNSSLIELLLEHGADPNIHVKLTTPLICLCDSTACFDENQLLHAFSLIVEAGANINAYNVHRETPLMFAAGRGHLKIVARLLELGSDINFVNCDGWSAIFYAVNGGYENAVILLKESGCNLALLDFRGQSLYDLASVRNFEDIAKIVSNDDFNNIDDNNFCHNENLTNYKFVLSEMPNYKESNFNGFYEDVLRTLAGVGMKNLTPLFIEKKISYGKFLINLDKNWKNSGVQMSFDRKKLITFAYNIIQKNWSPDVLIDYQSIDTTLFRIAQKLSNNVRIVHILMVTNFVCLRELQKMNADEIHRSKLKEVLNKSLSEIKLLRATVKKVDKILENIEEGNNKYPSDFIGLHSYSGRLLWRFINKYHFYTFLIFSFLGLNYVFKKTLIGWKDLLVYKYFKIIGFI